MVLAFDYLRRARNVGQFLSGRNMKQAAKYGLKMFNSMANIAALKFFCSKIKFPLHFHLPKIETKVTIGSSGFLGLSE